MKKIHIKLNPVILRSSFKYLRYILLSKHRRGHGIHSPFVYNLVICVFRNKIDPAIVSRVEYIRRKMINDHRVLNITDLGAGSAGMKKSTRKISDIARRSAIPSKYGILLANMAAEFGGPVITELGTSLGISSLYMALSCSTAKINTVEGCLSVAQVARENFVETGINNIVVHEDSFENALPLLINESCRPGLVFIDGNHRREPLLRYFTHLAGLSDGNTVIVIDDINYSLEMEEAWNEIKKNPKISVTVDIFRMGIVFFRKGISRSDYVIRY